MLLKKRALQVKLVKQNDADETTSSHVDPEQIGKIVTQQVQQVAIAVGAVLLFRTFLNTTSEIAIIAAKAKIH